MNPAASVAHLTPAHWSRANRSLVAKALAEFAHERLVDPEPTAAGRWTVRSDDRAVEYAFAARRSALDHWQVDADSITRRRGDDELPLDAVDLCLELRGALGLTDQVLPVYLEEITSTLASAAYKLAGPAVSAAELAHADFPTIETGMTEGGYPCFVANNGRIGFGVHEYRAYAPEAGRPVRLVWLAAHRDHATFSSTADLDYATLLHAELGADTLARFAGTLADAGLDPDDYLLIRRTVAVVEPARRHLRR